VPTNPLSLAHSDQQDIDASLACLPVFLAGCKALLVLAGPTYASRLWCVMEIFVYIRSTYWLRLEHIDRTPGA